MLYNDYINLSTDFFGSFKKYVILSIELSNIKFYISTFLSNSSKG